MDVHKYKTLDYFITYVNNVQMKASFYVLFELFLISFPK